MNNREKRSVRKSIYYRANQAVNNGLCVIQMERSPKQERKRLARKQCRRNKKLAGMKELEQFAALFK